MPCILEDLDFTPATSILDSHTMPDSHNLGTPSVMKQQGTLNEHCRVALDSPGSSCNPHWYDGSTPALLGGQQPSAERRGFRWGKYCGSRGSYSEPIARRSLLPAPLRSGSSLQFGFPRWWPTEGPPGSSSSVAVAADGGAL